MQLADYVTEMKEIKHPYKNGLLARRGIEDWVIPKNSYCAILLVAIKYNHFKNNFNFTKWGENPPLTRNCEGPMLART
jgi:hypothetical protein